jgi:DsbC/DsbD-like thiol-disulfide interchange protein
MCFDDGAGGQSIGYKQHLLLPLRIVPKNAAKPVTLRAQVNYAICEKLCVPVDASLELQFDRSTTANASLLTEALATVPKPAPLGEPSTLTVQSVRRDESGKNVLVDVKASDSDHLRLFVEGPTPDWDLPVPSRTSGSPQGLIRYSFALDGLPPGGEAKGAVLKFTLAGDHEAHEFTARLD